MFAKTLIVRTAAAIAIGAVALSPNVGSAAQKAPRAAALTSTNLLIAKQRAMRDGQLRDGVQKRPGFRTQQIR